MNMSITQNFKINFYKNFTIGDEGSVFFSRQSVTVLKKLNCNLATELIRMALVILCDRASWWRKNTLCHEGRPNVPFGTGGHKD
jgi:hypothetical protein